jgi:predicted dehydrogenase
MPSSKHTRVIVIGAGSIGERHVRAFRSIEGVALSVVESQKDRARQIADRYECTDWFTELDAVPFERFDAAVIATPADSHVSIGSRCAQAGLHLLIEKPLSASRAGIDRLVALCEEKQLTAAVGYTLRFHPSVVKVRELVQTGQIGEPFSFESACTHYLPDSRPDYRRTYYGSANAAAGVILDLSHELNYLEWILGTLRLEASRRASVPELGIADESTADLRLNSAGGLFGQIHLHAADRCIRRECHIVGSEARLSANLLTGEILVTSSNQASHRYEALNERDAWHVEQSRDFLEAIQEQRSPRCTVREALGTLEICLEAMKSPLRAIKTLDSAEVPPGSRTSL